MAAKTTCSRNAGSNSAGSNSGGASFVLRVRYEAAGLCITLQDVRTCQLRDFASWDALVAELRRASGDVAPPLERAAWSDSR